MWNGKNKAITFSFDDGEKQDIRAIQILNKYNLKATFNLNSSYLGLSGSLDRNGRTVSVDRVSPNLVKEIYKGHEVAVHTLTHPNLTVLDESSIIHQVESDRKTLSAFCGYEVVGMAYPCGGVNNDDRVAKIIKDNTGIKYSRTITSTYNFDIQDNLLRFNPTISYVEKDLFNIVDKFLRLKTDKPQLLYIWGHTYEMDANYISWEKFDELCHHVSNKQEVFYGTNREVLL